MSVMLIIFLSMAAYVLVLALLTWYGNSTEKQLGYPKQNETLEDVQFLLRQGENGLAASCYRRIHKCSARAAKKAVAQLPEYQAGKIGQFQSKR